MHVSLPNQKYLDFVGRYLLQNNNMRIDPFAIHVPETQIDSIYVVRSNLGKEMIGLNTKIVLGPQGSGKSTLFHVLPRWLGDQALVVKLPLFQQGDLFVNEDLMTGKSGLFTPKTLTYHIFKTYWSELLLNPLNRTKYLPYFRKDKNWMLKIKWFFQNYRPLIPFVDEEFEFMAWVSSKFEYEPYGPSITPTDSLHELVSLITTPIPLEGRFGITPRNPYPHICILVDETEQLSSQALERLFQDAERIHNLESPRILFTIFTNSTWEHLLDHIETVKRGEVFVSCLPRWEEVDLCEMLNMRLKTGNIGEYASYDWSIRIPDAYLTPMAKKIFIKIIVDGARQTYVCQDDIDAPIHALKLSRGLIAACAGCWEEQGYVPPIDNKRLENLVGIYWGKERI